LSTESLSALITLILQHWVSKEEKQTKLLNTEASTLLQLEHQWSVSPLLQFLETLAALDPAELRSVAQPGALVAPLAAAYKAWLPPSKEFDDGYIMRS